MVAHKVMTTVVNGVNVKEWFKTIDTIEKKPDMAMFSFRASNKWVYGVHCQTTIKDFYGAGKEDNSRLRPFILEADEPGVLLGKDAGPGGIEAALYALSSCLSTTFMYHASASGVKVEELDISLEGDMDLQGLLGISDDVRNGYENIRITIRVKADAPKERIEELCALAQKRSPVFDIVTNPVPMSVMVEVK